MLSIVGTAPQTESWVLQRRYQNQSGQSPIHAFSRGTYSVLSELFLTIQLTDFNSIFHKQNLIVVLIPGQHKVSFFFQACQLFCHVAFRGSCIICYVQQNNAIQISSPPPDFILFLSSSTFPTISEFLHRIVGVLIRDLETKLPAFQHQQLNGKRA